MDQSKMNFLQNVLRFSSSNSGGTTESSARGISPERKKWLENALNSMSINPIDEMKKCMNYLGDNSNLDRQLQALETLKDWCEDINFAIDFQKLDGYSLLPNLLNHENVEIRTLTCDLIGTCAQNNPYCQETLISSKIFPLVLQKLDKDIVEVKIKALFAISCLSREFEPGQKKLLEGNGIEILIKSLDSSVEKLKTKCCFLISSICKNRDVKNKLTSKRLIEKLIELYRQPDCNIHEHILSAINVLIDDNPLAIKQAQEMKEINFKQILSQRIENIKEDPRHIEEHDMAKKIFESLFQN